MSVTVKGMLGDGQTLTDLLFFRLNVTYKYMIYESSIQLQYYILLLCLIAHTFVHNLSKKSNLLN